MGKVVRCSERAPKAWHDFMWIWGHDQPELFLMLPSKWCILKGVLPRKQIHNFKLAACKHVYSKK